MTDYRVDHRENMKYSYLILIADEHPNDADRLIAERMWAGRSIDGLIPVKIMPMDDAITYWYNVTGMRKLSDHVKNTSLSGQLMSVLFTSLERLHETMLKYYMEEDHLVLDYEMIYLNDEATQAFFCYEPDHRGNVRGELSALAEKLIGLADHQDEIAVAYAYGFYQRVSESSGDIWSEITSVKKGLFRPERRVREEEPVTIEKTEKVFPVFEKEPAVNNDVRGFSLKKETFYDSIDKIFDFIKKGGKINGQNKLRLFKDGGFHFGK